MLGLGVVMAGLRLSDEADRLITQHRKPDGFPMKNPPRSNEVHTARAV
jgi:hypothetical protein